MGLTLIRGEYGTSNSEPLKLDLTSCCGIVLSPKNRKIIGAAHALVPGLGELGVENLTNSLLKELIQKGVNGKTLEAHLFGCAETGLPEIANIGEKNAVEARRIFGYYQIPIINDLTEKYDFTKLIATPNKILLNTLDYGGNKIQHQINLE